MKTYRYDTSEFLDTPEEIAGYLSAALETGEPAVIIKALGNVARARGMTEVARRAGVDRGNLYRALDGEHAPEFGTIIKAFTAFGMRLEAKPMPTD